MAALHCRQSRWRVGSGTGRLHVLLGSAAGRSQAAGTAGRSQAASTAAPGEPERALPGADLAQIEIYPVIEPWERGVW